MRLKFLLILTFAAFALNAAAQGGKLIPIESGISLQMQAPIEKDGSRKFFLDFRTKEVYECANHIIQHVVTVKGDKVAIKLKGIRPGDPCLMAMGPATGRVDLSGLEAGEYKLTVNVNRQVFKCDLTVTEDHYDFRMDKEVPQLFRITNKRLNKIPDNSIWGTVRYTGSENKEAADIFLQELETAGAQVVQFPVGNYGDFYVHKEGKMQIKMLRDNQFEKPFVYSYSGDLASLKNVMDAHKEKLYVTLKTTKGEVEINFDQRGN